VWTAQKRNPGLDARFRFCAPQVFRARLGAARHQRARCPLLWSSRLIQACVARFPERKRRPAGSCCVSAAGWLMIARMRTAAGVVLAGGRSKRMGRPKAGLEWHGSTLLYRTAALVARTVDGPVVVVAAPGQELPDLPAGVRVVTDPVEGLGPMQGLAAGLAAVAPEAPVAFACSTDMPFLHPAFIRRVLRGLVDSGADMLLPVARGFRQPLAAGYRTALAGLISGLVAEGDLRPGMLFQHCAVVQLDDDQLLDDAALARHDPALESVVNVNVPEDYAAARDREPPVVAVECFGALARRGEHRPRSVRAATLGAAAEAAGLRLDRHVVAAVNGDQVTRDPLLPLVAGDTVAFLSADAGG
jgi:molybdopterin-guanine dinucleotide biosynthesis protein A